MTKEKGYRKTLGQLINIINMQQNQEIKQQNQMLKLWIRLKKIMFQDSKKDEKLQNLLLKVFIYNL